MSRKPVTADRLQTIAQERADHWYRADGWPRIPVSRLSAAPAVPDGYCRAVAAYYERAPAWSAGPTLMRGYQLVKEENLRLCRRLRDEGLTIEPWLGGGQPYRDSAHLRSAVRETGRLRIYLTDRGHGPSPGAGDHPLRELSGVRARGIEFRHNDLFRAVHDVFGHVMLENGFGPVGEFMAGLCQMQMYPLEARPAVFTEQIGQICWFFYGPHLENPDGRLTRRGDPEYIPPRSRPYPEQKVFAFPDSYINAFTKSFKPTRSPDD